MMKVNIKHGNKSWELKEPVNLNSFDHGQFYSAIKQIQKQTNIILTQLVGEESATGDQAVSESESDTDEDGDIGPKKKRKKR